MEKPKIPSSNKKKRKVIVPFFTGDPFEQVVSILLAVMAILSLLIAYWNDDAAGQVSSANRNSRSFQTQAETLTKIGQIETSAYLETYKRWLSMNTSGNAAYQAGDEQASKRFYWINDHVLAKISPLLAPPYFGFYQQTAGGQFKPPNVAAFEADKYLREATAYSEIVANNDLLSNQWGNKTASFGNIVTFFAIALFLLGTATSLSGRVRWSFSITGGVLALVSLGWAVLVQSTPVKGLPPTAMEYYSYGVGWAHQEEYDKAISFFNQALEVAPDYSNAIFQRGLANRKLGKYDEALADYQTLIQQGKDDESLLSETAWAYYFNGQLQESQQTWQAVTESENTANRLAALFNLGLTQMASGNVEDANVSYREALDVAARLVAGARKDGKELSGSEWWAIDQAATQMDFLITCWKEQQCRGTPPYEKISGVSDEVKAAAKSTSKTLKEAMVGLEYFGKLPDEKPLASKIEKFYFHPQKKNNEGKYVDGAPGTVFADDQNIIITSFTYEGMEADRQVLLKVYINGIESPALRNIQKWPAGAVVGLAELPINSGGLKFETGFYWVELYIDTHLVQEGGFEINAAKGFNTDYSNADPKEIEKLLEEIPPNPRGTAP